MEIDKIKQMLEERFSKIPELPQKRHIIFWYDKDKSFKEIIDNLELKNVKILKILKSENKNGEEIETNIFHIKYNLESLDTESNFLIYSEYPRPINNENYLLDIELYSEFFEADKSSLIVEELQLNRKNIEIIKFIKEIIKFFDNKKRVEKLKKILENPKYIEEKTFKLAILASIVNAENLDFKEVIKNLILDKSKLNEVAKYMGLNYLYSLIEEEFGIVVDEWNLFLKILVITYFYQEIQVKIDINLEKYYSGRRNDVYVFVNSLFENNQTSKSIKEEFYKLGLEFNIKERIDKLEFEKLLRGKSFEYFDKLIIKKIGEILNLESFEYDYYESVVISRLNNTFWIEKYENFYKLILATIKLLKLKRDLIIKNRDNIVDLYNDYINYYYRVDKCYRHFYFYYDLIEEELPKVFDDLEKKISNFYEKQYLEILQELWSEKIYDREKLNQQKNFYKNYVAPIETRCAVIISDGLRYEVGEELKGKIEEKVSTKEINLHGMLTDLPSKTFLGMANLLPYLKEERKVNLIEGQVTINGINSSGTMNREKILKQACKESVAIVYDDLKDMNRSEKEDFIKGKKVIYIYHDSIDAIGDKGVTESRTFKACQMAIDELSALVKNLSDLGIVNIYITSDHGFLYERKEIGEYNKIDIKNELKDEVQKRYTLSTKPLNDENCISIETYGVYGNFPRKNQRIKARGSGLQFVHGGISPQEMIVPLIHYIGGVNSKQAEKVTVKIKDTVTKITSNLTKFTIYQLNAVSSKNKFIERNVTAALYDENIKISDEHKLTLNAIEDNYEYTFSLTLSGLSGDYRKVILKIMDSETKEIIEFKEYVVNMSITSDFDF